jgi:hypothetical protein
VAGTVIVRVIRADQSHAKSAASVRARERG